MANNQMQNEFLQAYDRFNDAIYRYCYFRVYERELAKELVQETYMKAWQYLATGKEVENLRAFLYKIAHNLIIDYSRKKKSVSLEDLMEQGFNPADGHDTEPQVDIRAANLFKVIDGLEEKYREVIILRYVNDLGPKEIAKVMNESENVISVRINRAIKKLRELMNHG